MARDKMFDPDYQKTFTEAILKENQIRRNWHLQYAAGSKRSEAINWDEDPLEDDYSCAEPEYSYSSREPERWTVPTKEERAWPASSAPSTRTIPRVDQPPRVMKPVPRDIKRFLYQGLSYDGEGRAQYLKYRYRDGPEERYYFPVCSSWEYGWTYGMDPVSLSCPKHSRRKG